MTAENVVRFPKRPVVNRPAPENELVSIYQQVPPPKRGDFLAAVKFFARMAGAGAA